ncbi:toll-interacting protein-like [Anneissia japonica]|uniref:toll-interacting protein-like n=1 Tax=Anneissia japonica TaxID=1529436 RepID=UPI0014257076|nr:toll-interacting protein-like [Anneissia japonica]
MATTRREQVMVGELPEDFLSIGGGGGGGPSPMQGSQQISNDEQTARMLQYEQSVGGQGFQQATIGRLSITVAQAKLAKNYGMTRMDPYCRIRVGHAVFETPTDSNGSKNPRWNKVIQCNLPTGVNTFYLEIFDEKSFTTDNRIAWAHVTIPQSVLNGETKEEWYSLSGKQGNDKEGMINVVLSYSQVAASPWMMQQQFPAPQVMVLPSAYAYPGVGAPMAVYPPMHPPVVQGPVMHQQQPPAITQEDLNSIQEMFPDTDQEVIRSVLEANRGNREAAVTSLLSMQ